MRSAFALLLLPVMLCAAPGQAKTLKPERACIDPNADEGATILDQRTLIYRGTNRRSWRTQPVGQCRPFHQFSTIITESTSHLLCPGDLFRVRDSVDPVPSAPCAFGPFVREPVPAHR